MHEFWGDAEIQPIVKADCCPVTDRHSGLGDVEVGGHPRRGGSDDCGCDCTRSAGGLLSHEGVCCPCSSGGELGAQPHSAFASPLGMDRDCHLSASA